MAVEYWLYSPGLLAPRAAAATADNPWGDLPAWLMDGRQPGLVQSGTLAGCGDHAQVRGSGRCHAPPGHRADLQPHRQRNPGGEARQGISYRLDGRGRVVAETDGPPERLDDRNTSFMYYDGLDRAVGMMEANDKGDWEIKSYAYYDTHGDVYMEMVDGQSRHFRYNLVGLPLWEGHVPPHSLSASGE